MLGQCRVRIFAGVRVGVYADVADLPGGCARLSVGRAGADPVVRVLVAGGDLPAFGVDEFGDAAVPVGEVVPESRLIHGGDGAGVSGDPDQVRRRGRIRAGEGVGVVDERGAVPVVPSSRLVCAVTAGGIQACSGLVGPVARGDHLAGRGGLGDGLVGRVVRVPGAVRCVGEVPGRVVPLRVGAGPVRAGGADRGQVPGGV